MSKSSLIHHFQRPITVLRYIRPLNPGKSAAIHINARYWHTMAGFGTDTHYVENYLYLEHLGQFEQADLVENLEELFRFQPQKEVDMRQMMY